MPSNTPKFWYKPPGLVSFLLIPLSWLYRSGFFIHQLCNRTPYRSNVPVICIGNAVAGGSGKTPTVIALTKILKDSLIIKNPYILTRGYGSGITKPTLVDLKKHSAKDIGDEPVLLARHAPTIISPNRADGAKFAESLNADCLIMDDGLQNNQLHKTISFLVIDRQMDFGNGKIIPAGPLRNSLKNTLSKTDSIICIGRPLYNEKPVFRGAIKSTIELDIAKNYIGFAGLGLPDKFKNTLLDLGVNLISWHPFPDHHPYSKKEMTELKTLAEKNNALLITTEKDFVRLDKNLTEGIYTLPIELEFDDVKGIINFIADKLQAEL